MKYMHTLDGKPAYYDGDQVVFAGFSRGTSRGCIKLANSLKQLRVEQGASFGWRAGQGLNNSLWTMDYQRVDA